MQNALRIFLLLTLLVTAACNQKRPAQRFNSREVPRGVGADLGANPAAKLCGDNCAWGKFYEDSGSTGFEESVKAFASVTVPLQEIGTIDFNLNGTQTGVWFWGEIGLQGGDLRSFYMTQAQNSLSVGANSRLAVVIYDSYSVQDAGLKPIVSYFTGNREGYTVTGTVSRQAGGRVAANIQFSDQWGMIRLNGYIQEGGSLQSSTFAGDVSFSTACSMSEDGNCTGQSMAPSETRLGKFAVEACRFFACQ